MADSRYPPRQRSRDIDISKPPLSQWFQPKINWLWFLVFALAFIAFLVWNGDDWNVRSGLLLAGLGMIVVAARLGWGLVVRRGLFTWMRLARAPARAMARGDSAGAERALQRALDRARRFSAGDRRRGVMLVELAGFVKNQGRYAEAKPMYEEAIEILARHQRSSPMDYFVALNNFAIFYIHLHDHAAAQRMLERVLDLTLVRNEGQEDAFSVATYPLPEIQLVLHLNLVFLFLEMHAVADARSHILEADEIFAGLIKGRQPRYADHYRALRALLMFALGQFANAASEVGKARNRDYSACLRVRAKLHLIRLEFSQAEKLLRRYTDLQRKKGSLHRPELRNNTLDLAESLFGQGKHEDAFAALQEARAIVKDFELPPEPVWRKALEAWRQRAQEVGRTDAVASLEAELQKMPATLDTAITISDRLRIRPRSMEGPE
jgi:tetratricopeptide (TPR) repeat protein